MKTFFISISLVVTLVLPGVVKAAMLQGNIDNPSTIQVGKSFLLHILLDPEMANINGVKGRIVLPAEVSVSRFNFDQSVILLWVDTPAIEQVGDHEEIIFSGLIPGGFSGVLSPYYKGTRAGVLFSVELSSPNVIKGSVSSKNGEVYLNNGAGDKLELVDIHLPFSVATSQLGVLIKKIDTTAPELFVPVISRSPLVFNDRWFVSFESKDKESGIDYYEISEVRGSTLAEPYWKRVTSPYELSDQTLSSTIYVRAHDKEGNIRIAELPPTSTVPSTHTTMFVWGILLSVIFVFLIQKIILHEK